MNTDKPNSPVAEKALSGTDLNAKNAARRRLLKVGATAGTAALVTLSSRPALACHCVMPSAWGSILATGQTDVNNLTGSIAHHKSEYFDAWTIAHWKDPNNASHVALAGKLGVSLATLNGYNVIELRRRMGYSYAISGLATNPNWVAFLSGSNAFVIAILVAELNLYTSNNIPTTCGNLKAIVQDMADGSYTPASGSTTPWTPLQIQDYLHYNWLARR